MGHREPSQRKTQVMSGVLSILSCQCSVEAAPPAPVFKDIDFRADRASKAMAHGISGHLCKRPVGGGRERDAG